MNTAVEPAADVAHQALPAAPEYTIETVHLGPTWELNPASDGTPATRYILPTYTLGWQVADWVETHLLAPDGEGGFTFTPEQLRFVLWWYAVDQTGRFTYRDGMLQRLKGWGKDPLAAVLSAVELVGPCRFASWTETDRPDLGLKAGEPVAVEHPAAWVVIAAVSKEQTRTTMMLFPRLFTTATMAAHAIDIGKEIVYAHHGERRIEAVTSSPRALEGPRPTFTIRNEVQHWLARNEGHEMAAVTDRNAAKSPDGASRILSLANAYEPSEDSVAQHARESYESAAAGLSFDIGMLYDSLEVPSSVGINPPHEKNSTPTESQVRAWLAAVLTAVRGDSTWLDPHRITGSVLDPANPPSRSRRYWFNQIVSAEDAWLDPAAIDAGIHPKLANTHRDDPIRAGWDLVLPDEPCTLFFDGSKSDDATALSGCRIFDGYVFTLGVWEKPPGERGKTWIVPRHEVDARVHEAFDRFNFIAFWGDPSHTDDDTDGARYWDGLIDDWHRRYADRLDPTYWPTKTGANTHAIMWDMASPERTKAFTAAAERFVADLERTDTLGEPAPAFCHDGAPILVRHLRNARKYPNRYGVSLWKGHRESARKIDSAVTSVGARMLARLVANAGLNEPDDKAGDLW